MTHDVNRGLRTTEQDTRGRKRWTLRCASALALAMLTLPASASARGRVERLPENQSLNLLNHASQIYRMDYVELKRNPNRTTCEQETRRRVDHFGELNAIYYYHRDSNVFGIPNGSGHCYIWLYDPAAPRHSTLNSALITSLRDALPPELPPLPGVEDAQARMNGVQFRHFGFHATESSDVCLKKANDWRISQGGNWVVWSHQANNCFALMSMESFVRPVGVRSLDSWWSAARADNWAGSALRTSNEHYTWYRSEGQVFRNSRAGTVPLHAWYSPSRRDYFTTTNPAWAPTGGTRNPDYRYLGIAGYVYSPDRPRPSGTIPLYSWWSPGRVDNFMTADSRWAGRSGDRRNPDYRFVRVEGYIMPAR